MVMRVSWSSWNGSYRQLLLRERLTLLLERGLTLYGIFHGFFILLCLNVLFYKAFIGRLIIEWE